MSDVQRLLDEKLFPHEGMSYEEMQFYLNNIIKNCKDICDTVYKVDNKSTCDVVEMKFKKNNKKIDFNGSVSIGSEKRFVDGYIYIEKNDIVVDMHIIRLCVECENKEYRVLDQFKLYNKQLKRKSFYNYNIGSSLEDIEDEQVKGKLL